MFPVGTGNNFALDLGVKTVEDMFNVIDRGAVHAVDAVKVGGMGGTEANESNAVQMDNACHFIHHI